jgi:aminoglycoside 3-N-acetyltransferase I
MTLSFTRRLDVDDVSLAKRLFVMMAEVFGEDAEDSGDAHIEALLSDRRLWVVAAMAGEEVIGGLTAHALPMTHKPTSALFIYDVAVRPDQQRRGVGRELVRVLRAEAARLGIDELFVLADNDDAHALDFYRALGAVPSAVTMFEFGTSRPSLTAEI